MIANDEPGCSHKRRCRIKTVLWWRLLCPLAQGAPCPTGQAKDEAARLQIEHTRARSVEQHDVRAPECILAHEFEEAGFTGSLIERSKMLASARNQGSVHYELSDMHARMWGEFGYVRGRSERWRAFGEDAVQPTSSCIAMDGGSALQGISLVFPRRNHRD